jgi:OTT_1508-like deaminase
MCLSFYAKIAEFKLNSDDLATPDDKAIAQLILEDYLAKDLSETIAKLMFKRKLSLDDIRSLMNLIEKNNNFLRPIRDGNMEGTSEANKKMAYHLCKITKIVNEIYFVLKKIQRHQQDQSLKSISTPFQFISLGCHAELAILKTAKDCCSSKTLYIGVSKRPCYCCSLFFKAIEENHGTDFNISIVSMHGKLYRGWSRIDRYFEKEFRFGQKQSRIL